MQAYGNLLSQKCNDWKILLKLKTFFIVTYHKKIENNVRVFFFNLYIIQVHKKAQRIYIQIEQKPAPY